MRFRGLGFGVQGLGPELSGQDRRDGLRFANTQMGCPQKYGPLVVGDDFAAPFFFGGVPTWDPNFGNYPHRSLDSYSYPEIPNLGFRGLRVRGPDSG